MNKFLCFLLGALIGPAIFLTDACEPEPAPQRETILVGTGCDKGDARTAIAVGWEEDDLPICDSIDVHTIERP